MSASHSGEGPGDSLISSLLGISNSQPINSSKSSPSFMAGGCFRCPARAHGIAVTAPRFSGRSFAAAGPCVRTSRWETKTRPTVVTVLHVFPSVLPREALAAFHGESLEARDPRFCGGVPFLLVRLRQIVRVNRRHAHCSSPRKDPGFTRGYSAACSDSWQSAQKACVPPTYCVASLSRRHSTTPPLAPTA